MHVAPKVCPPIAGTDQQWLLNSLKGQFTSCWIRIAEHLLVHMLIEIVLSAQTSSYKVYSVIFLPSNEFNSHQLSIEAPLSSNQTTSRSAWDLILENQRIPGKKKKTFNQSTTFICNPPIQIQVSSPSRSKYFVTNAFRILLISSHAWVVLGKLVFNIPNQKEWAKAVGRRQRPVLIDCD